MNDDAPSQLPVLNPAAWQNSVPPERRWALRDWIPAGQASYLTGPGSAGKSLLAQQLCTCVGLGLPFMGVETRQTRAIYITCEDDEAELHRRQAAICASLGVGLADTHGKLFLVSLVGWTGTALCSFDQNGELQRSESFRLLETTVDRTQAQFVGLDNVAHFYGGNENIRNEVSAFVNLLNGLALSIDGSVLFLGHPNKAGAEFSGSTSWENQVRARLLLKVDDNDPDRRELTAPKANYAPKGDKIEFRWHRGAFVRDKDLPAGVAAEIAAVARANNDNETFLVCLRERLKQQRAVSERHSPTYAPTEFSKMPEAKGLSKARFEAAMDRLFRIKAIERGELWKGPDRKPVFGLREVAGNGAGNGAGNVRETLNATEAGNGAGNAGETHTVSYGYCERGPSEAAAPADLGTAYDG